MNYLITFFGDLFSGKNFFTGLGICIVVFIIAFFVPAERLAAFLVFLVFLILAVVDYCVLFFTVKYFQVKRILPVRFSNGDRNPVEWIVKNKFAFPVRMDLVDEWPVQFQLRKNKFKIFLKGRQQKRITWSVTPVKRGEYVFGNIYAYIQTPLRIFSRRFTTEAEASVACYPSFVHLHQYELKSAAILANEIGNTRMRRIGQSMEFEQIKGYVPGDDIRTLNWKATARRGSLMVNSFIEERAQQVYCLIDKGRLMKMPFNGMTLLDYAINSTLVLSSVCLKKRDRIGLITFSNQLDTILPADNKPSQLGTIIDTLYRQETGFLESDFEMLYGTVRSRIRNRSLLILFTNFESISGLHRQLDYLRSLARFHLPLVIFFDNTELKRMIKKPAKDLEDVYVKTIAEKFAFEKKLIVKELMKYGIPSILAKPEDLTIKTINKYLELKTKRAL